MRQIQEVKVANKNIHGNRSYQAAPVNVAVDCDGCGENLWSIDKTSSGRPQYVTLRKEWDASSVWGHETHEVHLCQLCWKKTLDQLNNKAATK